MKIHVLPHNKVVRIPNHFLFFDTEAFEKQIKTDLKQQTFRLAVACYYRRDRNKEQWLLTKSKEELADFVNSKVKNKTCLYAFAHNLFYDLKLSDLAYNLCFKHKFKVEKVFINSNDSLVITLKQNRRKIVFIDSLNIFRSSIKQLGKVLNLPKLDVDVFTEDEELLFKYCKRDVEILKKAILELCNFLKNNDLGSFGWTVASTSFKVFRHKFMNTKIFIHHNKQVQSLEKEAYYGGRVEVYKCGVELNDCYKLDVNSMYPYVMYKFKYPTSLKFYQKNISIGKLKRLLNKGYLAIAEVEVNTDEPVYPFRYKDKLYFPVGRFLTYLSTPELKYAIENNHLIRIEQVAVYKADYIFKEFVNYMYSKRREAKEQGNKVYATFYKYILNSLYGKFAQRERQIIYSFEVDEPVYYNQKVLLGNKEVDEIAFLNKVFYIDKNEEFSKNSFCAIACHVTAYARMYLYQLIKHAGFENVYYVDTDCLITNKQGYLNLLDYINEYELGKLKLEDYGKFIAWNVKHYRFNSTYKCKSIPRKAEKKEDGSYWWWSFEKIRGSLKQDKHEGVYLTLRHRKPVKPYEKRKVLSDGSTLPLTADEIIYGSKQKLEESLQKYNIKEAKKAEREAQYDTKLFKERIKELLRDYEEITQDNIDFEIKHRDDITFWLNL